LAETQKLPFFQAPVSSRSSSVRSSLAGAGWTAFGGTEVPGDMGKVRFVQFKVPAAIEPVMTQSPRTGLLNWLPVFGSLDSL